MSGSLIGALRVTLGIDTAAFEEGLGIAQKRLAAAGKNLQAIGDRMVGIGTGMSAAITAPLTALAVSSVKAANESAQAIGQVNAALESMGPVAGKTSEQLQDAATSLMHLSTFDDDEILRSVTANMLTFGKVSGDAFDRAQLAAVNLSSRLGQDLQSSAIMVGKALNDPIKGVTALSRVGVSFTADQKEMIKAMAATGDTAGAQAIILGELERQYGGSAEAMRAATPGADLKNAWDDFQETIGAIVVRVLPPLTNMLAGVLEAFNGLSPGVQSFVVGAAAVAAAIGPVLVVVGSLVSAVGAMAPVFAPVLALIGEVGLAGALGAAATAAAPFIAAGAALAAAWALFGDKIGPVLSALSEKLQATLGPKLQALFETVKTTLTDLWNGPFGEAIRVVIDVLGDFGAAYTSILGEVLIRILSALVEAVNAAFKVIGDVFKIVAALLRGDFSAAWEGVKSLVFNVINGIINVLKSLAPEAVAAVKSMASGFATWLGNLASQMVAYGRNIIDGLVAGIKAAPQAVFNALKSVVFAGVDGIKSYLGINSPSRLFMEFGGFVTAGLAIGIQNGIGTVKSAMDDLSGTVGAGFVLPPLSPANDNDGTTATSEASKNLATMLGLTQEWQNVIGTIGSTIGGTAGRIADAFLNVVVPAIGQAGEQTQSFQDQVSQAAGAITNMFTQLFGKKAGGIIGTIANIGMSVASAFGAFKAPGRAIGGPVMANQPYVVGEKRPELFVPSTSGRIEPNLNGGRRGGNTYHISGNLLTEEFWDQIKQMDDQSAMRGALAGSNMVQTTMQKRGRQRLGRR